MLTSSGLFASLTFVFLALLTTARTACGAPTKLVEQPPLQITNLAPGVWLVDFEREAWGNLRLASPAMATNRIVVHFGEALQDGRVNRHPRGSVRYSRVEVLPDGTNAVIVAPPADKRNTTPPAVLTPPEWGVVLPFRWVEIEGWPGSLAVENLRRRAAFASTWDEGAAEFQSSDVMLNRIWELCRYSIKATTFAGVYVDGDRERIAYEADAYLEQLGHYACDPDPRMARDTFDRLMKYPTWPTEWGPHLIFMAHADWMQTGETNCLAPRYEALKSKLLLDRAGPDGLITSSAAQIRRGDLVDWPEGERDDYVLTGVNTVVNAFHLRALAMMADLARAVGQAKDAEEFDRRERATRAVFQAKLFDPARRLYRDGVGTDHISLHANLFPLAFGLVPAENRAHVAAWLGVRGMACSVYAAQYLLEGLFENDADATALRLMAAPTDRSWRYMVESGATITWEAWDLQYKPNMDWTHAWGAAPANLLSRFVLGAQPLAPGWSRIVIRPHTGGLAFATGKIPTPQGPLTVDWKSRATFTLTLNPPPHTTCHLEVPAAEGSRGAFVGTRPLRSHRDGDWWIVDEDIAGTVTVEVR